MTAKELRDWLDHYIKTDPPDQWMLNDCELDAFAYEQRKAERENAQVLVCAENGKEQFFKLNYANHDNVMFETKPAVIEKRKVTTTEKQEVMTFGNWRFDEKKGIIPGKPIYKDVEVTKTVPVEVSPAEHKSKDAVLLMVDLSKSEQCKI